MELTIAREHATRVVVVAPYALSRLGLVRVLESLEQVAVVAHAATADEARRLAVEYIPDVVVVDAEIASADAMQLIGEIKSTVPSVRMVVLADRPSHALVQGALEAGTDAFTLKDISIAELATTIERIVDGDTVIHPDAASVIAKRLAANGKERANALTPRQREVLRLLAAGLENKQIARRLGVGTHTVKTHVSRVLQKLSASSRTEAVVTALRDGLIS